MTANLGSEYLRRVNRVILAVGHPFPVFTAKQTYQASLGMSLRCHRRKYPRI